MDQTCVSVNATTATFSVAGVSSNVLSNMVLYFAEGTPENHAVMDTSLTMTPTLVASGPATGSVGGTILTLNVPGAATGTSGLGVTDANGTSICQTLTVTEYGKVLCHTLAQHINATTLLLTSDGNTSNCTTCAYEQHENATFPTLSSVAFDASSLTFTGSNIYVQGYNANVSLAGV